MLKAASEINYKHHESLSTQKAFKTQAVSLFNVIEKYGNPFPDDRFKLLLLNTRDCADDRTVATVHILENEGRKQYQQYKKKVIETREQNIHDAITKNNYPMLNYRAPRPSSTSKRLAGF